MKCITVQQPWAWAIVFGPKRIENRTWPTRHRGPLLIHAGKSRSRLTDSSPEDWQDELPGLPSFDLLHFGEIIGVVQLTDCVPVESVAGQPFAEGPWCWKLEDVAPIRPFFCAGRQRLFDVPHELIRRDVGT